MMAMSLSGELCSSVLFFAWHATPQSLQASPLQVSLHAANTKTWFLTLFKCAKPVLSMGTPRCKGVGFIMTYVNEYSP